MSVWPGSAFVTDWTAVGIDSDYPGIRVLFVQVAHGTQPSALMPPWDWFERARAAGWQIAAWAWCDGVNPEAEAAYHADVARSVNAVAFVANMETAYSAAGDSTSPKFHMPGRYLDACDWEGPLGVTTHPDMGSDMTPWRDRGAVYMPQAFPTENGKDVSFVVQWGQDWGWPTSQIRPLVQTYAYPGNDGPRADCVALCVQADMAGVGVTPYPLGNATTEELNQMSEPIARDTTPTAAPVPDTDPDWWEQAYKGGPMVKVKGFPRPLYPPDAAKHGKRPSSDGPDTIAYKRTVSRAGRWPWQPFDDAYSNQFSHGKSGNVKETGVAGVQRQQHIDATGWIGEKTFNTLRSIRCPAGPHEGEMAMDAYAAELINEAFDMYQGAEPPPEQSGTIREAALAKAITQIGYTESPAGSNLNKYGDWYGGDAWNGQPWCAMFATWCYELNEAGQSQAFIRGERWAYCPYIVADARAGRYGLKTTDDPIPGDLVVYDWSWDTIFDHVGLFEGWLSGNTLFTCIEGNTSTSNNSNGGQVMRRERARSDANIVFVRVAE